MARSFLQYVCKSRRIVWRGLSSLTRKPDLRSIKSLILQSARGSIDLDLPILHMPDLLHTSRLANDIIAILFFKFSNFKLQIRPNLHLYGSLSTDSASPWQKGSSLYYRTSPECKLVNWQVIWWLSFTPYHVGKLKAKGCSIQLGESSESWRVQHKGDAPYDIFAWPANKFFLWTWSDAIASMPTAEHAAF